jgi:hypothetical protein
MERAFEKVGQDANNIFVKIQENILRRLKELLRYSTGAGSAGLSRLTVTADLSFWARTG